MQEVFQLSLGRSEAARDLRVALIVIVTGLQCDARSVFWTFISKIKFGINQNDGDQQLRKYFAGRTDKQQEHEYGFDMVLSISLASSPS